MRFSLTLAAATVALTLVLPAGAAARTTYYIPPGNSSGSEYVESVPTASGNAPTSGLAGAHGSRADILSKQTLSALARDGTVGAQTAAFANATAPAFQSSAAGTASSGGSSPVLAVARAVIGLGGHGTFGLLAFALVAAALLTGAIAWRRRRAG
jgi:hypothetical protein